MSAITYQNVLAAKVAARNRAAELCKEWVPKLQQMLKPWVGRKVINQGPVLAKKVRESLEAILPPPVDDNPADKILIRVDRWHIYVECEHRAQYKVRLQYNWFGSAQYSWLTAYLGDIQDDDGKLLRLSEFDPAGDGYRSNFTVEEIIFARAEVNRCREQLREQEAKLCGFEMYDH